MYSPSFTLNGFDQECRDVLSVSVESTFEGSYIVVRDTTRLSLGRTLRAEGRNERTELLARFGIRRHRDDTDPSFGIRNTNSARQFEDWKQEQEHPRSSVEVVLGGQDDRFVVLHSLDLVGPFASHLDRSLDSFGTSVHHECHLESSELLQN